MAVLLVIVSMSSRAENFGNTSASPSTNLLRYELKIDAKELGALERAPYSKATHPAILLAAGEHVCTAYDLSSRPHHRRADEHTLHRLAGSRIPRLHRQPGAQLVLPAGVLHHGFAHLTQVSHG